MNLANLFEILKDNELIIGILGSLVAAGIVALVHIFYTIIIRLFNYIKIFGRVSKAVKLITGQIIFQNTNGQYMAAGDIKSLLSISQTIQKLIRPKQIPHYFSNNIIPDDILRENIISIGGPKYNLITKDIISKLKGERKLFPVSFKNKKLEVRLNGCVKGNLLKKFNYTKFNETVTSDFGLLIRSYNPYDDTKTGISWVIAGIGNMGCQSAADQLSAFIHGSKFRYSLMSKYLVTNEIGFSILKVHLLEGKYVSSEPVFWGKLSKRFIKLKRKESYVWKLRFKEGDKWKKNRCYFNQ